MSLMSIHQEPPGSALRSLVPRKTVKDSAVFHNKAVLQEHKCQTPPKLLLVPFIFNINWAITNHFCCAAQPRASPYRAPARAALTIAENICLHGKYLLHLDGGSAADPRRCVRVGGDSVVTVSIEQ